LNSWRKDTVKMNLKETRCVCACVRASVCLAGWSRGDAVGMYSVRNLAGTLVPYSFPQSILYLSSYPSDAMQSGCWESRKITQNSLIYKHPVRTWQKTHSVSITTTNLLMLFGEIIAVYCNCNLFRVPDDPVKLVTNHRI
jgi:hypothetical protein